MVKGVGFELNQNGELQLVICEYDPRYLVSYKRYKEIEAYLKEHSETTLEEAMVKTIEVHAKSIEMLLEIVKQQRARIETLEFDAGVLAQELDRLHGAIDLIFGASGPRWSEMNAWPTVIPVTTSKGDK